MTSFKMLTPGGPWAALDGSINAPTGTPQYPTLLNGYAARPPWKVAGVDYRVGIKTDVTLLDPATLPSGSYGTSTPGIYAESTSTESGNAGVVWLIGDNNVLNGYDLSLVTAHSNTASWIIISKGNNNTITNCNLKVNAATSIDPNRYMICSPIGHGAQSFSGLTITNCVIDGNAGSEHASVNYAATVVWDQNRLVCEYNWFKNSPNDIIDFFGDCLIQWNLFDTEALHNTGSDADGIQTDNGTQSSEGGTMTPLVNFNTFYQPAYVTGNDSTRVAQSGFGFQSQSNGSGTVDASHIVNGTLNNNTLVILGKTNVGLGLGVGGSDSANNTVSGTSIQNNYLDITGITAQGGVSILVNNDTGSIIANNINMSDGSTIAPEH